MLSYSSKPPRPPQASLIHILLHTCHCHFIFMSLLSGHQVPKAFPCCFSCLRPLTQAWFLCAASSDVVDLTSPAASTVPSVSQENPLHLCWLQKFEERARAAACMMCPSCQRMSSVAHCQRSPIWAQHILSHPTCSLTGPEPQAAYFSLPSKQPGLRFWFSQGG